MSAATTAAEIIAHFGARLQAASADPALLAASLGLTAKVALVCEDAAFGLSFLDGALTLDATPAQPDVTVSASAAAWAQVFQSLPPHRFHSFAALQLANPEFTVGGNALSLAQARASLERVVELLRDPTPVAAAPQVQRNKRQIRAGYHSISALGQTADLYIEEAGSGTPLLFLHTAGADSRQYLEQLADTELAQNWRLIAFDMPFHGRSLPPENWDGGIYELTGEAYAGWVSAVIEQYAGEPVVLAGCSMGAALTLLMAANRPELLRGVIAIEPPLRARGRRNPYLQHAAVATGVHNAAYVYGLLGPASPLAMRRRAAWIYSQGAPGVYTGDLMFYSDEFDGESVAARIDAQRLPVHLLCGRYDFSASIEDGEKLEGFMPGSKLHVMPSLGHFPMTEHPDLFRVYLLDALQGIGTDSK